MVGRLQTVLTRSVPHLKSFITNLSKTYANSNQTVLFALSSNVPESELDSLMRKLANLNSTGHSIGCLSRAFGRLGNSDEILSFSFAEFPASEVIAFRSDIPGKKEPQVGRWHSFREKDDIQPRLEELKEGVSWADVWSRSSSDYPLPVGLRELDPDDVDSLVYFTDLAPDGFLRSLNTFPTATKFGLSASSTPFITGQPVTLFYNDKVYASGAVGVALKRGDLHKSKVITEVLHDEYIGEPLNVTGRDGNMVISLNNANPAKLLLSAIESSGKKLALPNSFNDNECFSLGTILPGGKVQQAYLITAGDPSRGTISLKSQSAPKLGSTVQFLYHPYPSYDTIQNRYLTLANTPWPAIKFITVEETQGLTKGKTKREISSLLTELDEDGVKRLPVFAAASENGFSLIQGSVKEDLGIFPIPGSSGMLEWPFGE